MLHADLRTLMMFSAKTLESILEQAISISRPMSETSAFILIKSRSVFDWMSIKWRFTDTTSLQRFSKRLCSVLKYYYCVKFFNSVSIQENNFSTSRQCRAWWV